MNAKLKNASLRVGAVAGATAAVTLASPVMAFAAEEETGGIAAILPNMTEFIPMGIAFIILAIVLWKLGWPLFDKMLVKRETTIKEALEKSEAARIESEKLLEEYKRQLEDAKSQAAQIVADAKKTGESVKADIEGKAQAEADSMIEKAKQAIESEKKAAVAELQDSVADISIAVTARLVGEDLSDDEHRKIIERYVNEAGSFNAD